MFFIGEAGMTIVSIISMVRNEERYICDAVTSILNQENVDLELIVVDDYSTDSTFSILQELSCLDNRLKVFRNPGNGKVAAFRFGCDKAIGDYFAFFAGDDLMPKGSLFSRYEASRIIPSPSVLLSKIQVLSDDLRINGSIIPKQKGKGNPSGASIMIDRAAAKYMLDIPEVLPNEDTWMDLCIRFVDVLNVESHDTVACLWRVHSGNSITIRQGFDEFSRKFALRMNALLIFRENYFNILSQASIDEIDALIECETYRRKGAVLSIFMSRASISDKIRFMFYSQRFLFSVRRMIKSI